MTSSPHHQAWLFYSPLARQASWPQSTRTGRPGLAPDRLLRCCVLKHLKGWSFRDLERELRYNLIYRRFTHFDAEVIPRYHCFRRLLAVLSPEVTKHIHQRVRGSG